MLRSPSSSSTNNWKENGDLCGVDLEGVMGAPGDVGRDSDARDEDAADEGGTSFKGVIVTEGGGGLNGGGGWGGCLD
eukprot:CAMPEP_0184649636 /NCGR_PEP_ID=MMETSP0308-20130426/7034_1 /TAXON_ID=38269 /ORGANISM="Gloeochaete witrockiana, Strain SAG 46.84" /LENGTH=76 /DNA_ID=CAMNT_0027082513 /DNA_START=136 /DNA_END=367 /DNA_ORIENTATION=-